MKVKVIPLLVGLLIGTAVFADELHDRAMAATHDLQQAISELRRINQDRVDEFGGHMGRAVGLAEQAEKERVAALEFYRARHPGWQ